MLVSARTGEGKTLTYAIPIVNSFIDGCQASPLALILAPTRELTLQIEKHIQCIGSPHGLKTCSIVGGLAAAKQLRILKKQSPHVIIATPGRLWDLMKDETVEYLRLLNKVQFVVIDEGDRMIECGHFRELQFILDYVYYAQHANPKSEAAKPEVQAEAEAEAEEFKEETLEVPNADMSSEQIQELNEAEDLNKELESKSLDVGPENLFDTVKKHKKAHQKNEYQKQTIICSATLVLESKGRFEHRLSKKKAKVTSRDRMRELFRRIRFRDNPIVINLTEKHKLPDELHEYYIRCSKMEKDLYLLYYLRESLNKSVIVFCNSITCCRRLQSLLKMLKYHTSCLHSKMEQGQRLKGLDKFKKMHTEKSGKAILICTDVGARGIDIPDVENIVHYQLPKIAEVYVHRCGRTARIYKEGNSLSLISPDDEKSFKVIASILRKKTPKNTTEEDESDISGAKKYEVNYSVLENLRDVVVKATELESSLHKSSKRRAEGKWLTEMAKEAEIELDPKLIKENKVALDTYKEHEHKKKNAKRMKYIQREFDQEYQNLDMGHVSGSSFLSPEIIAQLNKFAQSKPLTSKKIESKRKFKRQKRHK